MFLKECPFCGKNSGITLYTVPLSEKLSMRYFMQCRCDAKGPSSFTELDAAQTWNERHSRCDTMTFEAGQIYSAAFTNDGFKNEKVHILHVLPSVYEELKLIIYKFWDRGHAIWVEKMCTDEEMTTFIKRAKEAKDENN